MSKKKRIRKKANYLGYNMSLDEIAEIEGLSKMQVRWAIKSALRKLKNKFKKYGIHKTV